MAAIAIFYLLVCLCFLSSSMSIGLSVQEKKLKRDFKDGHYGGHLGFLIGTILAIFDVQVTQATNQVSSQLAFWFRRRSDHLGFSIGTILAIFYLQVTPMLPTKFEVHWPFGSGGEMKNRCSRSPPWNDFSYF